MCFAAGTPYENGTFRMKLLLSHDFPQSPPKGHSLNIESDRVCFFFILITKELLVALYQLFFCFHRLLPNQNISSKHCDKWWNLCQHTEEGLESKSWTKTCSDCKLMSPSEHRKIQLVESDFRILAINCSFYLSFFHTPRLCFNTNLKTGF